VWQSTLNPERQTNVRYVENKARSSRAPFSHCWNEHGALRSAAMETLEPLIRPRGPDGAPRDLSPAETWRMTQPSKPMRRPRLEVIAGLGLGLIAGYAWGIVYGIIAGIIVAVLAYLLGVFYYWSDTIENLQERIQKLETQNRALQSDDPVDEQVDAGKEDSSSQT
jgi:hypothetical protein